MKFAIYCLLSPLFVAFLVLYLVGLAVRGAWWSFNMGASMPEVGNLRDSTGEDDRGPGGYKANGL